MPFERAYSARRSWQLIGAMLRPSLACVPLLIIALSLAFDNGEATARQRDTPSPIDSLRAVGESSWACPRDGRRPSATCVSWMNGTCVYSSGKPPRELLVEAYALANSTGLSVCEPRARHSTSCVDVISSACAKAASICLASGCLDIIHLNRELARLPPGQLRVTANGLEVNIVNNDTSNNRRLLGTPCSAYFSTRCYGSHSSIAYKSKFVIETATGRTIKKGWDLKPRAPVTLEFGELADWVATCQWTLFNDRTLVFTAGGGSTTYRGIGSGRFKRDVGVRCIAATSFTWQDPPLAANEVRAVAIKR